MGDKIAVIGCGFMGLMVIAGLKSRALGDLVAIDLDDNRLEMAKKYGCAGVQFWLGMFDQELIDRLHDEEIHCNLYFADTFEDYEKYFAMGIDTLLTNRMDLAADYRKNYLN